MEDIIKIGFYVLLLIPGFIYIQVLEYHFLKENKPQFEKMFQIVLGSAFIWFISMILPIWWPFGKERTLIINTITKTFSPELLLNEMSTRVSINYDIISSLVFYFVSVYLWTFIIANVWSVFRKTKWFDQFFIKVTGRDWHSSVCYKFFRDNLDKPIAVTISDKKYVGILCSAPDSKEDSFILIANPNIITNGTILEMSAKEILIKTNDMTKIEALDESIVK